MRGNNKTLGVLACLLFCSACSEKPQNEVATGVQVETSGKEATELSAVPQAVIEAALAARPDLSLTGADHEVRNGNEYYDVAGLLPDGSEIELDMTVVDGNWTVVEVQRDITYDQVPEKVRQALSAHVQDWSPDRIIEADQGDGITIYEFFRHLNSGEREKIEVKWREGEAAVLAEEWRH